MRSYYLLFWLLIVVLSCSKDDNNEIVQKKNFYALTVGNSWVYKYYIEDELTGEFTDFTGVIDSVSIISTQEIGSNLFYKFKRKTVRPENAPQMIGHPEGEEYYYLRDSLGYLINDQGKLTFINDNFEEHLWDQETEDVAFFSKLKNGETKIETEAGTFECLDMELYAKDINTGEQFPGLSHYYFANEVGDVKRVISWMSGDIFYEKRLDSQEIQ